jgi:phage terminase large subunit-like protein
VEGNALSAAAPKRRRKATAQVSRGERNARWIEKYCHVPEGQFVGQPIVMRTWQRQILYGIYDSPTRTAIVSFGRKNAKTTLAALLVLLHLVGPEAKANSQLYSAAQSRDQAGVLFKLAAKCVRLSPGLSPYVRIGDTAKTLSCEQLGTSYRALSADASTNLGLSTAFVVHDELGQVRGPKSELFEALETAAGAYDDPLSVIISTQAPTDADLLSLLIDEAARGEDPETKLFLYTAPVELDPFSEQAQRAANPAFGDFLSAAEVGRQAKKAKSMPSRESAYRNLILNQRVSPSTPFIPRQIWADCAGAADLTVFSRAPVWLALDLSARSDLTALGGVVEDPDDGVFHAHVEFFAPLDRIDERSKRDRAPYDVWARNGLITATPGASVDYDLVAERLCELCDEWDVVGIAFDRWRIDVLRAALKRLERELPLIEYGQGFRDMSPGLDALESALVNKKLRHGAHPVLTWCAANAIAVRDPADNRKLDKAKSTGRIDGIVTLAMAMGAAAKAKAGEGRPAGPSVYEGRGVLTV